MNKVAIASLVALCSILYALPRSVTFATLRSREGLVIVTGASTGIGRHAVEYLARAHPAWQVMAGVRKSADADAIAALGIANLRAFLVDVGNQTSLQVAVENLLALNVPVLALVNNAGISRVVPLEFHDIDDARAVFNVNFFGALELTQRLLPALRTARGRIVMISSVAGEVVRPQSGIYSASKFAIEAASDALRRELRPHGISVSIVQPAYVKTDIFTSSDEHSAGASSDEAARTYPLLFGDAVKKRRASEIAAAASPADSTTPAIEQALCDVRPLTRYAVAKAGGLPAWVVVRLVSFLPDRLVDLILR